MLVDTVICVRVVFAQLTEFLDGLVKTIDMLLLFTLMKKNDKIIDISQFQIYTYNDTSHCVAVSGGSPNGADSILCKYSEYSLFHKPPIRLSTVSVYSQYVVYLVVETYSIHDLCLHVLTSLTLVRITER